MTSLSTLILGWIPFVNPLPLPAGSRLWMFLPLAACVALVYRATRAKRARDLPKPTIRTFITIVVGMWLIAIGVYVVHECVLRFTDA